MSDAQLESTQFSNPLLVSAYDALNVFGEDTKFWLKEIERLRPKTIIDLGCGTGLLTCELAKRGYTMIGVEPAGKMLDIAREKPYADKVRWIHGGYEKLDGLQADMVMMTSHVAQFFLEDKEWQAMLEVSNTALSRSGYILFDSRPPVFPPYQTWPTKEYPRRIEDTTLGLIDWYYQLLGIEDNRVRYQLHFYFIDSGEKITSTDELIFRSQEELTHSLEEAGFTIVTVYGDWDGSVVTSESPELIFVAKRN